MIFPTGCDPKMMEIFRAAWLVAMRLVNKHYDETFSEDDYGWRVDEVSTEALMDRPTGFDIWKVKIVGKVKDDVYDCTLDLNIHCETARIRPDGNVVIRNVAFKRINSVERPIVGHVDLVGDLASGYQNETETAETVDEPAGPKPECYGSWS